MLIYHPKLDDGYTLTNTVWNYRVPSGIGVCVCYIFKSRKLCKGKRAVYMKIVGYECDWIRLVKKRVKYLFWKQEVFFSARCSVFFDDQLGGNAVLYQILLHSKRFTYVFVATLAAADYYYGVGVVFVIQNGFVKAVFEIDARFVALDAASENYQSVLAVIFCVNAAEDIQKRKHWKSKNEKRKRCDQKCLRDFAVKYGCSCSVLSNWLDRDTRRLCCKYTLYYIIPLNTLRVNLYHIINITYNSTFCYTKQHIRQHFYRRHFSTIFFDNIFFLQHSTAFYISTAFFDKFRQIFLSFLKINVERRRLPSIAVDCESCRIMFVES